MPKGVYVRSAELRAELTARITAAINHGKGVPKTPEHRAKISASRKGKPNFISPQTRAKMVAAAIGRKRSLESVAKSAASHRGLRYGPISDEHRAKIAAANHARVWTPEARAKVVAANKNRPSATAAQRAKISARFKGRPVSAETRAKLSAAWAKRAPVTAETRAKQSASRKGFKNSPEARAKMSRSHTGKIQSAATIAKRMLGRVLPKVFRYTKLAQALHVYLAANGFVVEPEVRFGPYTVDLYDREHHIAHEADGKYWHDKHERERPGYAAKRDAYLRERFGLPVMHYTDTEIRYLGAAA